MANIILRNLRVRSRTVVSLGLVNVLRVAIYRLLMKSGYYVWKTPISSLCCKSVFLEIPSNTSLMKEAHIRYFSKHDIKIKDFPDWFSNPWKNTSVPKNVRVQHWSAISDFRSDIGDVKTVWEASRFDWAPKLAFQSLRDSEAGFKLESWTRDWLDKNQPNQGTNWKCAQETSLRGLNILVSAKIMKDPYNSPSPDLLLLLEVHIKRILPTTFYAKAQANNHGTSEAVGLFCLGSFLAKHGTPEQCRLGLRSSVTGRKLLENRVSTLIMKDGSFTQQSTNYHRLVLDTIAYCELERASNQMPEFSSKFYRKMEAATNWLASFMDLKSGGVPNLGPNDGAYFLNIADNSYPDYRHSVNRALILFCERQLESRNNDPILELYRVDHTNLKTFSSSTSIHFNNGGYVRRDLPQVKGQLFLRCPVYSYRPGDCDANHLDLWSDGVNLLGDAGSYSYNSDACDEIGFPSNTAGHNSIMFDGKEQMPNLSRFLKGLSLYSGEMGFRKGSGELVSEYSDLNGIHHKRIIRIVDKVVEVEDTYGGFTDSAILRWRMVDQDYILEDDCVKSGLFSIKIATKEEYTLELEMNLSSPHYMESVTINVLKVTLKKPGKVVSKISIH